MNSTPKLVLVVAVGVLIALGVANAVEDEHQRQQQNEAQLQDALDTMNDCLKSDPTMGCWK